MPTDTPSSAPSLGSLADLVKGRDLDALVAEYIFEWQRVFVPADANGQNAGETLLPPNVRLQDCEAVLPKVGKIGASAFCRPWSESFANAQEVLERMRRRGFTWYMVDHLSEADPTFWHIECWKRADSVIHGYHDSNSMPESICRAALKALAASK